MIIKQTLTWFIVFSIINFIAVIAHYITDKEEDFYYLLNKVTTLIFIIYSVVSTILSIYLLEYFTSLK